MNCKLNTTDFLRPSGSKRAELERLYSLDKISFPRKISVCLCMSKIDLASGEPNSVRALPSVEIHSRASSPTRCLSGLRPRERFLLYTVVQAFELLVAGLRGVVQAFELVAVALESSFKRLSFDVPVNGGVTAASSAVGTIRAIPMLC